jgi:hypothetical protein
VSTNALNLEKEGTMPTFIVALGLMMIQFIYHIAYCTTYFCKTQKFLKTEKPPRQLLPTQQ